MKNNPNQAELIEIEKQEYKQRWVSNYFTDREYVKWLIRVGKYDDETLCKAFGADDEALRELRSELAREQIIEARSRLHPHVTLEFEGTLVLIEQGAVLFEGYGQ